MNTVRVNVTQLMGVALGLLVVVAGIIVNMKKFGTDVPMTNLALYAALGFLWCWACSYWQGTNPEATYFRLLTEEIAKAIYFLYRLSRA